MADEITTVPEEQELFQLSNGRYIMDEAQSRVMFQIKEAQPEHSHPISGTGYSWDESAWRSCSLNVTRMIPATAPKRKAGLLTKMVHGAKTRVLCW